MMLIITNTDPKQAVQYLINNTNKNYCFKQLIELCQLLSSNGITKDMKMIKQGKKIQEWILKNPSYTFTYFNELYKWCSDNINMSHITRVKLYNIQEDLLDYAYNYKLNNKNYNVVPKTVIWRYSKSYSSKYETDSELPIDIGTELYIKYIKEYKFKKY